MLKLTDVNLKLGDFALKDINLEISEGQYFVLLGRSGAGKTQLLELIAGLEQPDKGSIYLDNVDITNQRIQNRKVGIVFQDYAVFPHMTVYGNIAFPLKSRKLDKKTITGKVEKAADAMNIRHILGRNTQNLSGGELQRVALARTLITSPRLLLLDEPLSSLDASLKDDMKRLLRNLNKSGQTIIHVTHDYSDAISLAKKVGVIHNGRIIQEGSVDKVFKNPSNRFVARYAGMKNFFRLRVMKEDGVVKAFTSNNLELRIPENGNTGDCLAVMKSRDIKLSHDKPSETGHNIVKGKVDEIIRSEYGMEISVSAGDLFHTEISGREFKELGIKEKDEVWMCFPPEVIIILGTGQAD